MIVRGPQAVLEVYATHDIDIRPHVLLALVLYKLVDQVLIPCKPIHVPSALLILATFAITPLGLSIPYLYQIKSFPSTGAVGA